MVYRDKKTEAIVGLILNLVIPGVGSLIMKQTKVGIWQLVIYIVGVVTSWIFVGLPLMLGAWIWALITSIKALQKV